MKTQKSARKSRPSKAQKSRTSARPATPKPARRDRGRVTPETASGAATERAARAHPQVFRLHFAGLASRDVTATTQGEAEQIGRDLSGAFSRAELLG